MVSWWHLCIASPIEPPPTAALMARFLKQCKGDGDVLAVFPTTKQSVNDETHHKKRCQRRVGVPFPDAEIPATPRSDTGPSKKVWEGKGCGPEWALVPGGEGLMTYGGMGEPCSRAKVRSPSICLSLSSDNDFLCPSRNTRTGAFFGHRATGRATTSTTWDHGMMCRPR